MENKKTLIIAHRGSKGTKPENTCASFVEAVKVGADGIELDVHMTKDKELVVIHDETVDRTTNGTGVVKKMKLEDIKRLDAGSWFGEEYSNEKIPTLKEVFNLLDEMNYKGILNIEIKTDKTRYFGIEKVLSKLVEEKHSFKVLYSSFNIKTLKKINKYDKKTPKTYLVKSVELNKKEIDKLQKDNIFIGINPSIKKIKKCNEFLEKFTKSIMPWTVNSEEDILFCIDQKFKGLITDFPERALKIRDGLESR